jgi:hypothetical protein
MSWSSLWFLRDSGSSGSIYESTTIEFDDMEYDVDLENSDVECEIYGNFEIEIDSEIEVELEL